jgi:hypothetical protein
MSGARSAGALLWRSVSVAAHASALNTPRRVAGVACGSAEAALDSIAPTTAGVRRRKSRHGHAGAPNKLTASDLSAMLALFPVIVWPNCGTLVCTRARH